MSLMNKSAAHVEGTDAPLHNQTRFKSDRIQHIVTHIQSVEMYDIISEWI